MEKSTTKPKAIVNIFKFLLSKPTSLVYIPPHPPYSPGGENTTCANKGFVVSLIPAEARVRRGNKSSSGAEQEPTSPKVSCTGQIKRNKNKKKNIKKNRQEQQPCRTSSAAPASTLHADRRRENDRVFTENAKGVRAATTAAVRVGEMRRFASGRGGAAAAALTEVDWERIEREMKMDAEDCGVVKEGRKEVNLWKRRGKAARPIPLEVHK